MEKIGVNTKILNYPITGVQRYTLELLTRFGNRVERISPSKKIEGLKGHLWEQLILPRMLNGKLLWSPSNTGPLLYKNQVLTLHDVVAFDHPEWLNPKFVSWYKWLTPKVVRNVRKVITISTFSKERIIKHTGVDERKIVVIPNGVDNRFYPRGVEEKRIIKEKLKIPTERYILSLGSLEPRKNLISLIKAWEKIINRIPEDISLVITGGKGKSNIYKQMNFPYLPSKIYFTGHVADELLPSLYSGALVFVYLSLYEGFGLPPLEAMASGVPVLTSNVTAIPEVVGDAAYLVNPYSLEDISSGLINLISDTSLRDLLTKKGLDRARSFSWDKTAELTWAEIVKLL